MRDKKSDLKSILVVCFVCLFCFGFFVTEAQAVCQAETCGQRPSNPPTCGDGDCTPFVNPKYTNYPPENHGTCPADCSAIATCGDGVISAWENCNNCPADVPVCGPSCGDSICSSSVGETCLTCSQDCGACGVCGDGVCDCAPNGTETSANCPEDCGSPTTTTSTTVPACGNGVCNSNIGETCSTCPGDCGACNPCGNGVCNSNLGETCSTCPGDCGACNPCGNGVCTASIGENCSTCPGDCGECDPCGDGVCSCGPNGTENTTNCPTDCQCVNNGICDAHETAQSCPDDCQCSGGEILINGVCSCPTGQVTCGGTCVNTSCPSGQGWNSTTCSCECASVCAAGQTQDSSTCACSCSAGQVACGGSCVNTTCASGQTWDTATCSCKCSTTTCSVNGQTQDPSTCACSCPTGQTVCGSSCVNTTCGSGQTWDTATCSCKCSTTTCSVTGQTQDPSTCACSCPTGQVTCGGSCVNTTCGSGQTWDTATCSCKCSTTTCSVSGQTQNPSTCACSCPTGQSVCGSSCENTTCASGQTWDTAICSCKCSTTTCSVSGQTQNPSTCACSCPTGQSVCGNSCVSTTCSAGASFDTATCSCQASCVFRFTLDNDASTMGNVDELSVNSSTPQCMTNIVNNARNACDRNTVKAFANSQSDSPGSWEKWFDNCVSNQLRKKSGLTVTAQSGDDAIYFNASCQTVAKPTNTSQICDAGSYRYQPSPISLLWDRSFSVENLSDDVRLVSFPVDPAQGNKLAEWKASSEAPLLVYDPSGEGKITSGYQLFGNWTFGPKKVASLKDNDQSAKLWNNGFEALATLDTNTDAEISGTELKSLSLWFDNNRNGISEVGEVRRVSAMGVKKLFYQGSENNDVANAVVLKVGYERERAGKIEQGTAVDWFVDTVSSEIEYAQKAMITSAFAKNNSSSVEGSMNEINSSKSDVLAYNKGTDLVTGIWEWSSSSKNNPVKAGRFIISDKEDGTIEGLTMIELAVKSTFGATSLGHTKNFAGKAKLEDDGSVTLTFSVQDKSGAYLISAAQVSSDGKSMKGMSKGIVKGNAAKTVINYNWVATKLK